MTVEPHPETAPELDTEAVARDPAHADLRDLPIDVDNNGISAGGLQKLMQELKSRGFDDAALAKIGYENWLRVFCATWVD